VNYLFTRSAYTVLETFLRAFGLCVLRIWFSMIFFSLSEKDIRPEKAGQTTIKWVKGKA
jgi:hypothetical protein